MAVVRRWRRGREGRESEGCVGRFVCEILPLDRMMDHENYHVRTCNGCISRIL